jgi:hypothetical protein
MGQTTKLRLAAWGGAIAVLGAALGFTTATRAIEAEDCSGQPNPISIAYQVCR